MADASMYQPGTNDTNATQPSIPEDVFTQQFSGTQYIGPIRQLAGSVRRRGPFSSGISSNISASRNQLYRNPTKYGY